MKSYRDTMDQLHFTPEQKAAMVDGLLAAAQPAARRRRFPVRRVVAVAAAAALVLTVGTAGASGVLRPASDFLAGLFGGAPAQTEIIDRIGRPIGASDTAGGVTITADAIIGDRYSYAILYSIQRDDGAPLADGLDTVGDGLLPLSFESGETSVGGLGGAHGSSYFYDANPDDPSIQYVEQMTRDTPLEPGTARARFKNLRVFDGESGPRTLVEGSWSLRFDFAFEDSSVSLPAGQAFQLNGMDATLDSVLLSPLSIQVNYTVDSQLQWDHASTEDGRMSEHDQGQSYRYFESLPIVLTFTDGTTLDLTNAGGSIDPSDGKTVCQKSRIFDEIYALDTISSVTVGGIILPVQVE